MLDLRGRRVRPACGADPERRLVCAVLVQALRDAKRGKPGALDWLQTTGAWWCEALGFEPVGDWTAAAGRLREAQREVSVVLATEHNSFAWRRERKERREAAMALEDC